MSSSHSSEAPNAHSPPGVAEPDVPAAGYPRLADFMSKTPEAQIFRSFSQLNILNILRLQAELHDLDKRLAMLQILSPNTDHNTHFWTMRNIKTDDQETQASLLDEIDRKLERYSQSIPGFVDKINGLIFPQTLLSYSCMRLEVSDHPESKTWTACWRICAG